jgi:hypothetical protein
VRTVTTSESEYSMYDACVITRRPYPLYAMAIVQVPVLEEVA